MKIKTKIFIRSFEPLSAYNEQTLIGGFSTSFSTTLDVANISEGESNNCLGGNCSYNCDIISPSKNVQCNTYSGCGN